MKLEAIKKWLDTSKHKPWCEQAADNIYSSDGDCNCGLEEAHTELQLLEEKEALKDFHALSCINRVKHKFAIDS